MLVEYVSRSFRRLNRVIDVENIAFGVVYSGGLVHNQSGARIWVTW